MRLPSLLPIGLGAKSGDFKALYLDTFQRIVIRNEDIQSGARLAGQAAAGDHGRK